RALVETVCRAAMVTGMARAEVAQSKAVAGLKKQGVEIHYWRGEELQAFRAAYDEV
ncbi:MAG: C4-dicarboxylate ABC transporter, partial [Gammaproteobacteria bacterium]|nr:C4-dicarboxylate ABC transporter [Gammaproteobacteria bacterium]NIT64398.1 C4-dicarboxylate ABC transporter [Gammaproteobacteria bacterium]NIV21326.1 C4-dicarboxylate ABC transporter [Gammaproteobacteria bacterium]NIY32978.1 C4-dicarboxylate ABC transporter [Gammaproteobacteria bacterium]